MLISDTAALAAFCAELRTHPFLTIDTEFLRDKTYYPQLCLIQMAGPDIAPRAVDPLADGLDMTPLFDLLADANVVKVFHAARQDIEIFVNLTGAVPRNIFDTQVAAMVCGHGDQIGYLGLVQSVTGARLDKGAQFTDWSRRPLSEHQMSYALDDVTYLRDVYLALSAELKEQGRETWVQEEMAFLTNLDTYRTEPENAWLRLKLRTDKPKVLSVLREIAAWREREAQTRNVPRGRILKDEQLADIAIHMPKTEAELADVRGFNADMARGKFGAALLSAIKRGVETPRDAMPMPERKRVFPGDLTPALEMLKMLLRIQCAEAGVATKLVADSDDLEALAMNDTADIPALHGWRLEVFGSAALALKHGKVSLSLEGGKIVKTVTG